MSSRVFICLLSFAISATIVNATCIVKLLVPAYANPCCSDQWSQLINTTTDVPIHAILNPASGPGADAVIDGNYINSDGSGGVVLDFAQAGGVVHGYVATGFGARDINDVKADIDKYFTESYWRGAGVQITGIFFDEQSQDLKDVPFYQELKTYVKNKRSTALVITNPGTYFTQNPTGSVFTITDYANTADVIVTFENTENEYLNNYVAPTWINDFTADNFAHLVHSAAVSTTSLNDMVSLAVSRKGGFIYITDDLLIPNPWDSLPTYWSGLVAAVETEACAPSPSPAPSRDESTCGVWPIWRWLCIAWNRFWSWVF